MSLGVVVLGLDRLAPRADHVQKAMLESSDPLPDLREVLLRVEVGEEVKALVQGPEGVLISALFSIDLGELPGRFRGQERVPFTVGHLTGLGQRVQGQLQPTGGLVDGSIVLENLPRPSSPRDVTGKATGSIAGLLGALEVLSDDPHPGEVDVTEHLVVDVSGTLTSSPRLRECDLRVGPLAQIGVQAANVVEKGPDPVLLSQRIVRLLAGPVLEKCLGKISLDIGDDAEVLVDHGGEGPEPRRQSALEAPPVVSGCGLEVSTHLLHDPLAVHRMGLA